MTQLYGGIEAGGTKFVCAVGNSPHDLEEIRFPTTTPGATLQRALDFFLPYKSRLTALGIGAFGPLDLNRQSATYGYITATPKAGWTNTDILGVMCQNLELPARLETDVNAAALAEGKWGAARGLTDYVYFTIGTGIGGGVVSGGQLVHGLTHPELGHCMLPKHPEDHFSGICPFHGDRCFEGLASGPALQARWQREASELRPDHVGWDYQAFYISAAMVNTICSVSPQRIILGGGVMAQQHLFERVRRLTLELLNGYVGHDAIVENMNSYIVPTGLGDKSGIVGAIELAKHA